jgi:hypothetical protein
VYQTSFPEILHRPAPDWEGPNDQVGGSPSRPWVDLGTWVEVRPAGTEAVCHFTAEEPTSTLIQMIPLDVGGPVTIEVFTVANGNAGLMLTGPCGAAPWLIETGEGEHPLDTAVRIIKAALPDSLLVHSTSWRFERNSVVLTFLAVVPSAGQMDAAPVDRSDLARNAEHAAPDAISYGQVLEHALRHLAWLAKDDDVVRATLDRAWLDTLRGYVPEPFQQLS